MHSSRPRKKRTPIRFWAVLITVIAFSLNLKADETNIHRTSPSQTLLQPVPDLASQAKVLKLIQELHQPYPPSRDVDRQALAKTLLTEGAQTQNDTTSCFVLLREARELFAQSGDLESAFQAVDVMGGMYAVDVSELKAAVLERVSAASTTKANAQSLVEASFRCADECADRDRYDIGLRAMAVAERAAPNADDPSIVATVQVHMAELRQLQKDYTAFLAAEAKLKVNPLDGDANAVVGRFLCFCKREWQIGLPMLAKGADSQLKAMAQKELTNPIDAKTQADLGDGWWEMSEKFPEYGASLRTQSVKWYAKAILGFKDGLRKDVIQHRLASIHGPGVAAGAPRDPKIAKAIQDGVNFLYNNQQPWGHWDVQVRTLKEPATSVTGGQYGGYTAISVYALLCAGEDPSTSIRLQKALGALTEFRMEGVYAVSLRIQALTTAPNSAAYRKIIAEDVESLRRGTRRDGRFSYLLAQNGPRADLSCTLYGWLGFAAAEKLGLKTLGWNRIVETLVASQNLDGTWWYTPGKNESSHTMTPAGLTILLLAKDKVSDARLRKQADASVIAGMKWMDANFTPTDKWTHYHLLNVQRVGLLTGTREFNHIDWYKAGCDEIVKRQLPDGSWGKNIYETSMAIIFLARGGVETPLAQLQSSSSGRNQHPPIFDGNAVLGEQPSLHNSEAKAGIPATVIAPSNSLPVDATGNGRPSVFDDPSPSSVDSPKVASSPEKPMSSDPAIVKPNNIAAAKPPSSAPVVQVPQRKPLELKFVHGDPGGWQLLTAGVHAQVLRMRSEEIKALPKQLEGAKYVRKYTEGWLAPNSVAVSEGCVAYIAVSSQSAFGVDELKKAEEAGWILLDEPFYSVWANGQTVKWKMLRKKALLPAGPVNLGNPPVPGVAYLFFFQRASGDS